MQRLTLDPNAEISIDDLAPEQRRLFHQSVRLSSNNAPPRTCEPLGWVCALWRSCADCGASEERGGLPDVIARHLQVVDGTLSNMLVAWQPWWLSTDAHHLKLRADGTAMVKLMEELRPREAVGTAGDSGQAGLEGLQALLELEGAERPTALELKEGGLGEHGEEEEEEEEESTPPPPSEPLPRLTDLFAGVPSPHLRWHVLEVLYAYCLTLRLFNGEYAADPVDAASLLVGSSAVLSAAAAALNAPAAAELPTSAKVRCAAPRAAERVLYSDAKVANRNVKVWHGATENGP
jgi:hypothetical protein